MAFTRYYSSQGLGENTAGLGANWTHSFAQRLDRFYAAQDRSSIYASATSSFYPSRSAACASGWAEIKGTAFAGTFQNASATDDNGLCRLTQGSATVVLEIHSTEGGVYDAGSFGYGDPNAEWHVVERPSGVRYLFRNNGGYWTSNAQGSGAIWVDGTWQEVNGRPVRLARPDANTWRFTDTDDTVEEYDQKGYVRSVTDRQGQSTLYEYQGGRLTKITDAFGHALQMAYSADTGLLQSVTGPSGTVAYQYDANNQKLTTVIYPDDTPNDLTDNPRRLYHYEKTGFPFHLTGITDENNIRYATWDYDDQGRAILSTHAGDADHATFTYNLLPDGTTTTTLTNPLSGTQTYRFTVAGGSVKLAGIVDPVVNGTPTPARCPACDDSSTHDLTYDANGNVASRTDFNGATTTYQYDLTRSLETSRTEAVGTPEQRTVTTEWHLAYRLPTRLAEPQRLTTFVYHGDVVNSTAVTCGATGVLCRKSVQETSDLDGHLGLSAPLIGSARTWAYTYNSRGQLLTEDGPRTDVDDTTTYAYYDTDAVDGSHHAGDLSSVTNALGQTATYDSYHANGRPTQITDPNGVATSLGYDARGHLTSLTRGGLTTTLTYKNYGALWQVITPAAGTLEYGYDEAHRLISITNGAGEQIVYTLDNAGNRTQEETFAAGATTATTARNRQFDTLGRLWKLLNAAGQETHVYAYEDGVNLTGETAKPDGQSANDRHTGYTYDALDRLKTVTDALTGVTQYGYDGLDHLIQVQDPNQNATIYTVTGLGDPTQETSPDRGTTTRTFDEAGNVKTSTDARSKTTQYTYDALNRRTLETYADGTQVGYTYDQGTGAIGRLSQITDPTGTTAFRYDSLGRLIGKDQTTQHATGPLLRTVSYAYDPATGRLASLTYPSGAVVQYGYDAAGRPSSLTLTTNAITNSIILDTIAYQPLGPVKSYRLPAVTGTPTIARGYDADGRVTFYTLANATKVLTYDRLDQITKLGDQGTAANDQTYGYDPLGRLANLDIPSLIQSYSYDPVGNRTQKIANGTPSTYTYDPASNRLATVDATAYTSDAAGNTLTMGATSFGYDARGRLASATPASGVVYSYGINGLGQRVTKTATTLTSGGQVYAYDEAGHLLGEYNRTGERTMEHVYFGDRPVAVIGAGGLAYYVLSDHLDTPRQIVNASNQLRWRWDPSDPFGGNLQNSNPAGLGNFTYRLRFPGQFFDWETGLHYNVFRDYQPGTGRYIESDPIGLAGGLNTYAYVGSNPLNRIDPDGRFFFVPLLGPSVAATLADLVTIGALGQAASSALNKVHGPKEYPDTGDLQSDIERGANDQEYKRICDEPPPPDLTDPCERAKWELNKAKRCKAAREENTRRWWGGVDNRHNTQLFDDLDRAIQAAEDAIKRHCKCK